MINLTVEDNNSHLQNAIGLAGHKIQRSDNQWRTSDDVAVQAIIDSFDSLPATVQEAKERLIVQADKESEAELNRYPKIVRDTFVELERQALLFIDDNNASVPMIEEIATKRGRSKSSVANKVKTRAENSRAFANEINARIQYKNDLIDAASDWKVVQAINMAD